MKFLQGIEPRKYQSQIFESCKEDNCLVVLPTGLGKTLIALMLAIHRSQEYPGEKIVFLAPTKPLAEQHLEFFKKHLPELFGDMQLFTGQVKSEKRKKIWQTADIIFSTPQCVANDVKKGMYDLSEVSLLVEDEAHRCVKNYDYNFLAKNYMEKSEHPLILGMTASPGSDKKKIKQICENLSIGKVELRSRKSSDVKDYLQELEFEKLKTDLPGEFWQIKRSLKKIFDSYIEFLKDRKMLFKPATKINLINLQKEISQSLSRGNKSFNLYQGASACAQAIKMQHAIELIETQTVKGFNNYLKDLFEQARNKQSKGVERLVSKPEFNFAYMQSSELLTKNREHPKIELLLNHIVEEKQKNPNAKLIVFTQFRDTASVIANKLNQLKDQGISSKVFVGQANKSGSNSNKNNKQNPNNSDSGAKGLSQKEQKRLIQEFSRGEFNVLTATSIAEEGLDIPEVNSVIFYEPIPSAIRSIQRKGRTARLMKGKLIMLITRKTRDESFFYVSRSREKKMESVIEDIKEELENEQSGKSQKEKQQTLS